MSAKCSSLIVLALAHYISLKPVSRALASLALLMNVVEATGAVVIVLVSFIGLQMLNGEEYVTAFSPEQPQVPVGSLLILVDVLQLKRGRRPCFRGR